MRATHQSELNLSANKTIGISIILIRFLFSRTDECCAVRHKGRWYRAYCLEVCFDGFVTMHFIDYGNMQLIEVNDVRAIPDALLFECYSIEATCFSDYGRIEFMLAITY